MNLTKYHTIVAEADALSLQVVGLRAAALQELAVQAGLVAGETRLRQGEYEGVFREVLNFQEGRVWVAVWLDSPPPKVGSRYPSQRQHFYGDWYKVDN